ncbi:hypothetical protein Tco_0585642 [Tanacetum coccineum]
MSLDQAYHSQLTYHQQQQKYGFQNYSNSRNTPPQFFSQQSSQPHYFPQQSSQPPFKVPQAKDPRDGRRRQKNAGKQHVVDLDDGDDDDMDYRRKCDAGEKAYEAKREKELAMMQCRELEFLMLDPSSLPPAKRPIIEKKQAEIMRKYPDA